MEQLIRRINELVSLNEKLAAGLATALKLILIVILAYFALRLGHAVVDKIFFRERDGRFLFPENKTKTLSSLAKSFLRYFILFILLIMILQVLGIDYTPILASAGILGLAVGFGAQNLIRDIITGLFILFEGQYSVGDYITIDKYSGTVEELSFRITRLKDFSGEEHIIPNGKIEVVTNHTKGLMRALVDVDVAYEEDLTRVHQVLEDLCSELDEKFTQIKEGPNVLGVNELGSSGVTIRIAAYTEPMAQWKIEREIRKAIKERFDREKIEIPYPRRVIFNRQEKNETEG
ncbi:MAG: mechanosensitive ion channel protein MscS [Firmicutes bacterium HGW-Firmicutes-13]|nr:MAG: mechanosensitive ion channel protein MscS [Firmicutes bacterium HGW-Firmicutes-13]